MKTNSALHNTFLYFKYNFGKLVPLIIIWSVVFYLSLFTFNVTSNIKKMTESIIANSKVTLTFNGRFFSHVGYSDASFPYNFNITNEISELEILLNEFKLHPHINNVIEVKRMYNAFSLNSVISKEDLELTRQKKQLNIYPYTIPMYGIPTNYSNDALGIEIKEGRYFKPVDYNDNIAIIVNENSGFIDNDKFIPYKIGDKVQLQIFSNERVTNVSLDTTPDSTLIFEVIGIYKNKVVESESLTDENYQYNKRFYITDNALTNYLNQWIRANLEYNKKNNVNSKSGLRYGQLPLQYGYHEFKLVFDYFPEIEQLTDTINNQLNALMHTYPINEDNQHYHATSSLDALKDSLNPLLILSNILITFSSLTVIIFTIILYTLNKLFIKSRTKELAIYRSMGNCHLFNQQLFIEQLIIIIIALPISTILTFITTNFLMEQFTQTTTLYSILLQQATLNITEPIDSLTISPSYMSILLPLFFIFIISILYILIQLIAITKEMSKKSIRTLLINDE